MDNHSSSLFHSTYIQYKLKMPARRSQREKAHRRTSPIARPRKNKSRSRKSRSSSSSSDGSEDPILKIIAAIFWDLNVVTMLHKMVQGNPSKEDLESHQTFWENTRYFVHKAVNDHSHQQFQDALSLRCANFIRQFGWKFFTICAHAEAFLRACLDETDMIWEALKETLAREERSLEVFARTHGLRWQYPLLSVAWQLPELERVLAPEIDLSKHHHGEMVLTENGRLRFPRFEGKTQVHIDKSFFARSTLNNTPRPDPSLRMEGEGSCWICMVRKPCNCVVASLTDDLVQLTEYPNKGVGVRALTNIKAGDIIGEFIGEIIPASDLNDKSYETNIYDMELVKRKPKVRDQFIGDISPAWRGNWVRFINHSCESSTQFIHANVGKRVTVLVQAMRDISIFEEITVNYGEQYWNGRQCLCGSPICVSRK